MTKKGVTVLGCLMTLIIFCAFTPAGPKDYKLNFSAKITKVSSPDSLYHMPNKAPFIMVHTTLSNPNDYWVLYVRYTCDNSFQTDTPILQRTMTLACNKNVADVRALAPKSTIEEDLIYTSPKTLKEIKGLKFKLAYRMEAFDTRPASFKREEVKNVPMPDVKVTAENKSTFWSEALEVK